jgi:hypothetical protein
MTNELLVMSDGSALGFESMSRVRVGLTATGEPDPDDMKTQDGRPLSLVFRAILQEPQQASEWECRVRQKLEKSGIKVGNEFFSVNDTMVKRLCDAAAHADSHEWLISPADAEFVDLAMQRGRARRDVDEAFNRWAECGRSPSAEIRINSYTQYRARNERRIRDLQASYVKPRFYNDGEKQNAMLDYAISRLNAESRKWRREIVRLRRQVEAAELAFSQWQSAARRVKKLEKALASRSLSPFAIRARPANPSS